MSTVRVVLSKAFEDSNGLLVAYEIQQELSWHADRFFVITAKTGSLRGNHAHRTCWQALVTITGEVKVSIENLRGEIQEITLADQRQMLEVPPYHWSSQLFLADATLLVLASSAYDEGDYIRSRKDFDFLKARQ